MLTKYGSSGGLNAGLSFWLPLDTTVVPNSSGGSSTPTFTRATAATVFDWESILKTPISGEVRFQGARRVRNILGNTFDLSVTQWTLVSTTSTAGATDPNGGTSAYTVTATGANGTWKKSAATATNPAQNVNSVWVKRRTGSGTINIFDPNNTTQAITVTAAWQRFSILQTTNGAGNCFCGIQIVTSGDAVDVWHPQSEDVGGQSNQNPGEYVSVGELSSPFQGAMVDGVQYFSTQNGNTVASNVVTAGTGAAIASTTLLGYLSEEARTNKCLWNRDFTNAAWVKTTMTVLLDQTGIDGAANSASSLLATGANSTVKQTITVAAVNRPFSVYMKRITGTGNIQLAQDGVTFTTQTLTTSWQRFTLVASQLNPVLSINIVTSGDKIAVDYAALEDMGGAAATFALSPIATTTVAVTRNADVLTFPASGNIVGTVGAAYAEGGVPVFSTANNQQFVGVTGGGSPLYIKLTSHELSLYDNTLERSGNVTSTSAAAQKFASSWSGSACKTYIAGVASASLGFDGDLNVGANLFIGSSAASVSQINGTVKNVKLWTVALADSQIAAL